jgi:hypothetical protein
MVFLFDLENPTEPARRSIRFSSWFLCLGGWEDFKDKVIHRIRVEFEGNQIEHLWFRVLYEDKFWWVHSSEDLEELK